MAKSVIEFLWVAVPKALGGALLLGLNIVLLRQFDPAGFGAYTLCISTILLADAIVGSAFDLGVLRLVPHYRATDAVHAAAVEKAALLLKFFSLLTCGVLVAVFASPLGRVLLHDARLGGLLVLSSVAALSMLTLRSGLVYLQVRQEFAAYGRLDLLHNILKYGGVALALALVPVSPALVLILFAVAPGAAFLLILRRYWKDILRAPLAGQGAVRELLGYVKWFLLTFGVGSGVGRMDIFILTALSSLHEVGILSGGQVYALIPELLGTYLAVVISPRIMPLIHRGQFYPFLRRVQTLLGVFSVVALVLAVPLVTLIAPLLLPAAYTGSAEIILILLPGALASLITFPLNLPFLMFMRPRLLLTVDLITAPLLVLAYVVAIRDHGAIGAAWVTSTARVAKAALAQFMAWRLARAAVSTPMPAVSGGRLG